MEAGNPLQSLAPFDARAEIERRLRAGEAPATIAVALAAVHGPGPDISPLAISRVRRGLGLYTISNDRKHRNRPPLEAHRAEIEERTRNGESCEQIAEALRSTYGIQTSLKSVSRKRVEWGLRARATRNPNPIKSRKSAIRHRETRIQRNAARKVDIAARTAHGETAEQIAEALTNDGMVLKKGASTIWRLQTFWGLIPPHSGRSQSKAAQKEYMAKRNTETKERRRLEKEERQERVAREREAGRDPTAFYPPNCISGPRLRTAGASEDSPIELHDDNHDSDDNGVIFNKLGDGPVDCDDSDLGEPSGNGHVDDTGLHETPPTTYSAERANSATKEGRTAETSWNASHIGQVPLPTPQAAPACSWPDSRMPTVNAEDTMSAELLIDLSTSVLGAANHVKALLSAVQLQRPMAGSPTALPPTEEEVLAGRKRLKEAARCVWELTRDMVIEECNH